MPKWTGFIGGSHTTSSLILSAERTVNLYPEQAQSQAAKNVAGLFPTPGFQAWANVPDVGSRGAAVANGRLFFVIGSGLYEFTSTGGYTKHGTVAQDSNPAQMVYNGTVGGQLGIASGGSVYTLTLSSNTFAGPHFAGATATMLAYADGYGLAFDANTGRVYLSGLNDVTSWSLVNYFARSKFPDPWRTMFVDPNGLIWMVGDETFEVWYDANPASTQPWAPLSGLYGRYGIVAPFAFSVSALGQFWAARGPEGGAQIIATSGSIPKPISTYAVNTAIAGYLRGSGITDTEMLVYQDQGHTFPIVSFPSAGATWAYDVEGSSWAERGQWQPAQGDYGVWAPRVHADCFGKHLVGDRSTGTVWWMDTSLATEVDGTGIRRLRRSPGLTNEHQRTPLDQIELLMDTGVAGQNLDPQALMRMSVDGGRTFGNERRASFGRIGEYQKRVYWTRCGAPTDAVIECVWSDNAPTRVIDAWVNNAERAA